MFQNKLVSSFFKLVPKYILFLAKLKEEVRPFWNGKALTYKAFLEWKSIDLSLASLTCRSNVNYYERIRHPIPT